MNETLRRRNCWRYLTTFASVTGLLILNCWAESIPGRLALKRIPGSRPRNIVFILSDDHRYDFMGFMGKPSFLQTPSLDRLASQGVHFQNAFVTTSLCSPSRASILTGQYSHRHGVVDNNTDIAPGTVFFPQYLQKAGYATAFIGKWHMGHESDEPRPGFDRWISFRGQGDYFDPDLNVDGTRIQSKGYITDILTEYAIEWLKQKRTKPFFLYLSHKAVHSDFRPAPRHQGRYARAAVEYPASMANTEANYRDKPRWVREQRDSYHGVDFIFNGQMDFDTLYRRYCETLLGLDESVGQILRTLEELGVADSTLVVYMGDNGFSLGEHGLIDKRQMYEESMRVPLLAYAPGLIPTGSVVTRMVQNVDLAPTFLEAAGLEPPAHMDGRSLLSLLRGRDIPWRDAVFYEYYWEPNYPQTPAVHGVRTDRYKYIRYYGLWDIDELYDLREDPQEMHNLIKDPARQDLVKSLNSRLFDWLEHTGGMQIPLRRDRGVREDRRKGDSPVEK